MNFKLFFNIYFLAIFIMFFTVYGCKTNNNATANEWMSSGNVNSLKKEFGDEFLSIIGTTNRLIAYRLDPVSELNDITPNFNGFNIIDSINVMQIDSIRTLLKTILVDDFFPNPIAIKNCTFLPDFSLRFYSTNHPKNHNLDVLVAFYCDSWQFSFPHSESGIKDSEKARLALIEIARNLFPDSQYFNNLKNEIK